MRTRVGSRQARWQQKNSEKAKAHSLAKYHKDELAILSECGCEGEKENHHPDYNKPLEIMRLCKSCHTEADKQRRRDGGSQQTQRDLAVLLGITHYSLNAILKGRAKPSLPLAIRIEKESQGKYRVSDLIPELKGLVIA